MDCSETRGGKNLVLKDTMYVRFQVVTIGLSFILVKFVENLVRDAVGVHLIKCGVLIIVSDINNENEYQAVVYALRNHSRYMTRELDSAYCTMQFYITISMVTVLPKVFRMFRRVDETNT